MAHVDLPLHELQTYRPAQTAQPDFAQFWIDTLREAAQQPLNVARTPLDLPYRNVCLLQMTYAGWGGTDIVGTYVTPAGNGPFPAVAMYHGYGSRRPEVFHLLGWASQGYAILAIDIRGQSGESSDSSGYLSGHVPGYLTMGIGDPHDYYYRGVYIDAVRAVAVLAAQPEVDAQRIGVTGGSQGGALTLATAALYGLAGQSGVPLAGQVRVAFAEIPFLCHFERAAILMDAGPYQEIGSYCRRSGAKVAQVFRTLSYFDCMNLTSHISVPTFVTLGLMDSICPPSTVFAAYNQIVAPREVFVAYFGEHETFPGVLDARTRWFATHLLG